MNEKLLIAIILTSSIIFSGCASMEQKQKMFQDEMNYNIGRRAPEIPVPHPTSITSIENGKSEYLIEYSNTGCKWIFVVDDKTKKVESWRYVSDPQECYMEINWLGPW